MVDVIKRRITGVSDEDSDGQVEIDILKAARQAFSGLSHNLPLSK